MYILTFYINKALFLPILYTNDDYFKKALLKLHVQLYYV